MNQVVQTVTEQLVVVFTAVEEILNDWKGEGNLQFPALVGMMSVKMNWTEKQAREADPIIRYYVRNNPNWHVTRGAHGGIMKSSDKNKKQEAKAVKDALKQQMKASIEAKVAKQQNSQESLEDSKESLEDSDQDTE